MLLTLSSISPIWASAALASPTIELSPSTGPPGTSVDVGGSGFIPLAVVTITFDGGSVGTSPKTIMADALGNFEASFSVPQSIEKGTYPVIAKSHGVVQAQAESLFQVTAPNERPVSDSQSVTLQSGEPIAIKLKGSDPDGDSITFSIVDEPKHGTIENFDSTAGTLTYSPADEYHGKDRLTFKVNDGQEDSFLGEVSVTVEESSSDLTMEDMQVEVTEDSEIVIFLTAGNEDSSSISFEIVDRPSHGSLGELKPYDKTSSYVTYTPLPNFNGTDFFTAKASDSRQESEIATVTIVVSPVQDSPVAQSARLDSVQGTTIPVTLIASDPDGDTLSYILVTLPSHGTLTGTAPSLNYLPDSEYRGWDSFTFKVNDGSSDSNVARVEIYVPESASADEESEDGSSQAGDADASGGNSASNDQDAQDSETTAEAGAAPSDSSGEGTTESADEVNGEDEPVDSPRAQDTTPPRLIVPASPLLFESESESGTAVNYNIAAIDDRDGEITPECSPESGYIFPVGRVNVVCNATDSSGNTAVGSFVVEVKPLATTGSFKISDYSQPVLASVILGLAGVAVYVGLRVKRASARNSPPQTATEP